jgi:glycerol-3-phosphate acyltransferase PlsX
VGQRPAIALDAAGGDNAPQATVAGAQLAVQTLGVRVLLIGDEVALRAELATQGIQQGDDVRIVHAPDAVAMDEHGAAAARRRRQTSMQLVANAVRDGEAVAGVSAGNSGAFYATSLLTLGRIPGIDRPAIATLFPTATGRCLILDVGANAECKPTHLRDFALMGSLYFGRDQHIAEPRVGLLSNGEEPTKGPPFVQEAHQLIAASAVRFLGNVEGKDVPKGAADVVVCDGYAGNVLLKTAEGVAEALVDDLRKELTHNLMRKVLAAGLRPAFRALRDRLDYAAYGGAPLLGLNGVMIVAHGRSNARAIMNAIRVGRDAAAQGIVTSIGAVGTQ